jgi:chromosome segregation ATPase
MPEDLESSRREGARPDPSLLTTAQLQREVASLKELFQNDLTGKIEVLRAQIAGIEKAIDKAAQDYTRVPTALQEAIGHLQALHDERFNSIQARFADTTVLREEKFHAIQQQFAERDVRTDEATKSSKVAVDAALQAAKEAVAEQNRSSALAIAKSEAATDKRIDQIVSLVSTATSALDGKIVDIKDRLVRIEGQSLGQAEGKGERHLSSSFIVSVIAVVVAVASLVLTWGHAFGH